MKPTDEQFERIARFFDGEQVELTADEETLAGQIRDQEQLAAAALDAEVPPEALVSARASMAQELTRPAGRNLWFKLAIPTAVAAVIVLSFSIWVLDFKHIDPADSAFQTIALADESELVEIMIASEADLWLADTADLEDQLLMASLGFYDEADLALVDQQLQEVYLEPETDAAENSL